MFFLHKERTSNYSNNQWIYWLYGIPALNVSSAPKTFFVHICLHSAINQLNSYFSPELDLQNRRLILWYVAVIFFYKLVAVLSRYFCQGRNKSLDVLLLCVNSYRVSVALYKSCGDRTTLWWKDSGASNKGASSTNLWICSTSTPRLQGSTSSRWSVARPRPWGHRWWNLSKDQVADTKRGATWY